MFYSHFFRATNQKKFRQWLNQAPVTRYLDDIRDSPTYKFVQELEGRGSARAVGPYEQSGTIKNLNRYFGLAETNNL